MATDAIDRHQPATAWPTQPQFHARARFQPGPPNHLPESDNPLPPHNDVELNREMLITVLDHFSKLVAQLFTGRSIRMVVHGGACMLLHSGLYGLSQIQHQMIPTLPRRTTTRDVDYIHRSFVAELAACGMPDAAVKLQECIRLTARHFGLGADWMNSDADIALPMAHDPSGKVYDPIYTASVKQNNIDLHTIFRSANGMLTLVSVTPFWAVSLKLVRYTKWDPGDICLLLRNGMVLSGTNWTPDILENWLYRNCWPMGYHNFDSTRKADMRARILHAIELLSKWSSAVKPPGKAISALDAMGGGDVMGSGEHGSKNGWSYSFGKWPNQVQQPQKQGPSSSVQFPVPTPAAAPPAPVNVRDWIKDDDPAPKESHSPKPRSRQSSAGRSREIFIPPETDWINSNHPPASFRPRSRNPTPDVGDDRWHPSESNQFHSGPRVPRADPYSLESFDRSLNSMLHQSHHRNANMAMPSNAQPVIPVNVVRKQNEKRRKKDRKRERQSKWSGHRGSDTSDSSDEDEPRRMPTWYSQPTTTTTHQQLPPQPPQIRIAPAMHPQNRSRSQQDPPTHHRSHLNLTSPGPAPVSSPSQMPMPVVNHMHIGLHSPPQSLGPAQLAQYQFEQQQKVYEFQKQQQQQQQQQQRFQQQQQQQLLPQPQYHHQLQRQHSWNNASVATVYR